VKLIIPLHQRGGGIGTVANGLVTHLPDALPAGIELEVVGGHLRDEGRPSDRLRRMWFEQVQLPWAARGAVVHLADHRPIVGSRAPFSITVHDVFFLDRPDWFPAPVARYKRAMLAAAIRKSPRVIVCDSEFTHGRLLAHYPTCAPIAVVIHPGVEVPPSPSRAPASEDPYFVTLSTIEPRKNHTTLLAAFTLARRSGLRLRWKVIGRPGYLSSGVVRELQATDGVDVLGLLPASDVDGLVRGAEFVAVPSHAEGFGYPPLEAMARDVAVCCSRGSALDETVGDAALRVDADDRDAWADALLRLQDDSNLRGALREHGAKQARRFSWERAARAYAEVLADAA
jgi:glycosyltransferase involved in cell wall biosynthesis